MVNKMTTTSAALATALFVLLASGCKPDGPKQPVLLEIDRMAGTQAVRDSQVLNGENVSLADIYEAGGVSLRIVHDQSDLERQDSIRLADLHALMTANRDEVANEGEWHIHMLVVTEEADRPDTLGIMFDFGDVDDNDTPREAFAVFESAHETLPGGLVPEVLLTSAHELAHVFNLHHTDWEGQSFQQGATIESYSMTDSVLWRLSNRSIAHLMKHDKRFVSPGEGNLPFTMITQEHADRHQSIPPESYDVIDADRTTASRGPNVQRDAAVRGKLAKHGARMVTASSPVKLKIEAPKATYVVGEPVIVSVVLENTGSDDVTVIPQLQPEYRLLSIGIQPPDSDDMLPYRAPVIRDARRVGTKTLAPGERYTAEAKLFLSADGWTFEETGDYVIQASYPAGAEISDTLIESEPVTISIVAPDSEATTAARRLLMDNAGRRLGKEQGLYIYLEGGDHLTYGASKLKELVEAAPNAKQATAARLALGNAALNPTYDPARRARPAADLDQAMQYFEGLSDADNLPKQSIERVGNQLTYELEKVDRIDDATKLREDVIERLRDTTMRNPN